MSPAADRAALLSMTRHELHAAARQYFKTAGPTEPEVALVEHGDTRLVFKDYGRARGWFARIIAPILIAREASGLVHLHHVAGVPQLVRRVDRRGLLIEYCPGVPWGQAKPSEAAYGRLADLLATIHRAGIAHGDLRGGGNFLVDNNDRPYIVDFVARVKRGSAWNLVWNWVFTRFVDADNSALVKLRARHAPHLVSLAEKQAMAHRGRFERLARSAGETIRRATRHFATRD